VFGLEQTAEIIERCQGRKGELQLQKRGEEYEIIYNGVFLMASYNGATERAAAREALRLVYNRDNGPLKVLMGGLGMGYSLQETLVWKQVERAVVVEIEPEIIRWNREILGSINSDVLGDSRTIIVNSDFREVLANEAEASLKDPSLCYQMVMVDTDNGSSWLSLSSNTFFYSTEGLQLIKACLSASGVASFWCSRREEAFEDRLKEVFTEVIFRTEAEKTGLDGCYYLAGKAAL